MSDDLLAIHHKLVRFLQKPHQIEWEQLRGQCDGTVVVWLKSTLRNLNRWQALARRYEKKPMDDGLLAWLCLGWQRVTDYPEAVSAIINRVVSGCKHKQPAAWRMCLALLWRYARQMEKAKQAFLGDLALCYTCPVALLQRVQQDYPERWRSVIKCMQEDMPISIRLKHQVDREQYRARCVEMGVQVSVLTDFPHALTLKKRAFVPGLPGYKRGDFWVQDIGAQLLEAFLPESASTLLDVGSAPGGKAFLALDRGFDVTALDSSAERMLRLQENLDRLQWTQTKCLVSDVLKLEDLSDYKVIVLDAPCSASGVMSKHPESKWCYDDARIMLHQKEQVTLLSHILSLAQPNTRIIYSTCSIFSDENDAVIEKVLAHHKVYKKSLPLCHQTQYGHQVVPSEQHGGYYYACIDVCAGE